MGIFALRRTKIPRNVQPGWCCFWKIKKYHQPTAALFGDLYPSVKVVLLVILQLCCRPLVLVYVFKTRRCHASSIPQTYGRHENVNLHISLEIWNALNCLTWDLAVVEAEEALCKNVLCRAFSLSHNVLHVKCSSLLARILHTVEVLLGLVH